jgi:GxxExxY protein
MKHDDLTKEAIGCAYKFHNTLGPGFLEKVYENALRIELEGLGLTVKQQEPIKVVYVGQVVGEYYADLWVDEHVVIELKAVQTLVKQHEVQLVKLFDRHRDRLWSFAKLRAFSTSKAQVPRIQAKSAHERLYPVSLVSPVLYILRGIPLPKYK